MKQPCVYILANKPRGTLYIGVTSNLVAGIWQHKNELVEGFSEKYEVHLLVYYELHETMLEAIKREKQLKKWNREWKLELIEDFNDNWADLYKELCTRPNLRIIFQRSTLNSSFQRRLESSQGAIFCE